MPASERQTTIFCAAIRLHQGMTALLDTALIPVDPNRRLADTFRRERARLRSFIRRRVLNPGDADDILQDVFRELVEADRLTRPIEQVGAWLFQVARHRITDLLRRRRTRGAESSAGDPDIEESIEEWLPDTHSGPAAMYARRVLLDELDEALGELPDDQRRVFVAHELDGRSFKELATEWGVGVNTLLSRKRYAVLHLRRRLQAIYDDFVET